MGNWSTNASKHQLSKSRVARLHQVDTFPYIISVLLLTHDVCNELSFEAPYLLWQKEEFLILTGTPVVKFMPLLYTILADDSLFFAFGSMFSLSFCLSLTPSCIFEYGTPFFLAWAIESLLSCR